MNKITDFLKKYWLIALVVLAISVVIVVGSKKGWFSAKSKALDPTDAAQDGSVKQITENAAHNMAVSIHDTFDNHWLYWDSALTVSVLEPLYDLSDADLIAVSNKYNSLYSNDVIKENRSLKSIIQGELLGIGEANALRDEIVQRLSKLGA